MSLSPKAIKSISATGDTDLENVASPKSFPKIIRSLILVEASMAMQLLMFPLSAGAPINHHQVYLKPPW